MPARKRKREEAGLTDFDQSSEKRSNMTQESEMPVVPLNYYYRSKLIDFHSNLRNYRNMKELMDVVFEANHGNKVLCDSLVLLILRNSGLDPEEKSTLKIVECANQDTLTQEEIESENISEDNSQVIDFWHSLTEKSDYYIKFKQLFSILVFSCIEEEKTGEERIKAIQELLFSLITFSKVNFRFLRIANSVAFNSLFRGLVANFEEIVQDIKTSKSKKKRKVKENQRLNTLKEVRESLVQCLACCFEYLFLKHYHDISPIIREQIFDSLSLFYNRVDFDVPNEFEIEDFCMDKVFFFALKEAEKSVKFKALEFCDVYLRKRAENKNQSKDQNFDEEVFQIILSRLLKEGASNQAMTKGSMSESKLISPVLTQILAKLCEYNPSLKKDKNFERLKKMAIFSPTMLGKQILQIISKEAGLKVLRLEIQEDIGETHIPSAQDFSKNFEKICNFLNDKCLKDYSPKEVGEGFCNLMLLCGDLTLFNFKLYASNIEEFQKKLSKSKKKASKTLELPEILMYCLRHSCLVFKKIIKKKNDENTNPEEKEYYDKIDNSLNSDLLEILSIILSTYKVDDPILIPAIKIFDAINFKLNTDNLPESDLAKTVLESLLEINDIDVSFSKQKQDYRRSVLSAIGKLSFIPACTSLVKSKIGGFIAEFLRAFGEYEANDRSYDENKDAFCSLVTRTADLVTFDMLQTHKAEGLKLYHKFLGFLSAFVVRNYEEFEEDFVTELGSTVNTMYLWLMSFIISKVEKNVDDLEQEYSELNSLFESTLAFYRTTFEEFNKTKIDTNLLEDRDDQASENDNQEEIERAKKITRIHKSYLQWLTDFCVKSSNDALGMKYPRIYQEISKESISNLSHLVIICSQRYKKEVAENFARLLQSNTNLFASPLGHTYFSVFGDPRVIVEREIQKSVFSIIRFYKEKEKDKSQPKGKMASVQVWSIFILMIMNEYTIGRPAIENIESLRPTLIQKELDHIPSEKISNYICCSKIVNVIVEFLKKLGNPKTKEREAIIFLNTFFFICNGGPERRETLPCLFSILRFRKILNMRQLGRFRQYFEKMETKYTEPQFIVILNAIKSVFNDNADKFGKVEAPEQPESQSSQPEQNSQATSNKKKRPSDDSQMLQVESSLQKEVKVE
ncbi:unnamed protein product [Moneuplotes crassus]|uniref:Uncharacterized protein n=1 Tax=Euplotes crassus TaxID=5936 RepID=A0AAD1XK60_EUPCR|nr:unnamed protein product [Moneuplotes crassus]